MFGRDLYYSLSCFYTSANSDVTDDVTIKTSAAAGKLFTLPLSGGGIMGGNWSDLSWNYNNVLIMNNALHAKYIVINEGKPE